MCNNVCRLPLHAGILFSLISCYLVNRSFSYTEIANYFDYTIAVILFVSLVFHFFLNKAPIKVLIFYFVLIGSAFVSFSLGGIFNIHWLYSIIAFEILRTKFVIKSYLVQVYSWLFFSFIIIQVLFFRFEDGRPVLSITDPNYSAYYLLVFSCFLFASRKIVLSILVLALAMLSISRLFFLTLLILILLKFSKGIFNVLSRINALLIVVVVVLAPILSAFIFLSSFDSSTEQYVSGYDRLSTVSDQSNFDRSIATLSYLDYIFAVPFDMLTGTDIATYTYKIFYNTPHSTVYQLIFNYGFLYALVLFSLLGFYRKIIFESDGSKLFVVSLTCYMVFLGGVLYGPQIILLALIISTFNSKIFYYRN